MDYKNLLAQTLSKTLNEKLSFTRSPQEILNLLEIPKNEKMGDLAFPCFLLAKELKKSPPAIAKELEPYLVNHADFESPSSQGSYFAKVEAMGPYLNFTVNKTLLSQELIPKILDQSFLKPRTHSSDHVMVEFSQPNTHKEFHVGHIRTVAIGDALVRLYRWMGHQVTAANYIGDVGTHIAKSLWYLQNYFDGEVPKTHKGEFLGNLYVKANSLLNFKKLTLFPYPGVKLAQVVSFINHPTQEGWTVLQVNDGHNVHTVVCGGEGFKEGDFVAYVPVGIKFQGRDVVSTDKDGILSEGMILSYVELGFKKVLDKNKIFVWSEMLEHLHPEDQVDFEELIKSTTPQPGLNLTDTFVKPHAEFKHKTVTEEMAFRKKGVSDTLKAIEKKEPKTYKLWQETRQWSLDEFNQIYKWLHVHFDHFFYESEVSDSGKKIILEALDKGLLIKSEGAVGADLSDYNLPFFLLLKSDGTGLYSTKDISLAQKKFDDFHVDRSIYVVDSSQSLHFQQVFKTLELLGYQEKAQKCYHLAYGMVEGPEGKMSSRQGNIILFSQFRKKLIKKIKNDFLDKYEGEWPEEEIKEAAHKIALSTIKYGMLNHDNNKNILFDMNEWTARTGNTGPYLMYAYARIRSIYRESGENLDLKLFSGALLEHETEKKLLAHLMQYQDVVERATYLNEPQQVCIYLYQLAKDFNQFYGHCSVLKADKEELKQSRLALAVATGEVLKCGLNLLGIETVERM